MIESVDMPIGTLGRLSSDKAEERMFRVGQEYDQRAWRNTGHPLSVLAQLGGLGWCEAAAIVQDRAWHRMDQAAARVVVYQALGEGRAV